VTLDNVYEVFTTPRDTTGLQGIHFRFMPDMQQVKHALQVRQGGRPKATCTCMPAPSGSMQLNAFRLRLRMRSL
jgi:hypothetical protein